MRCNLHLLTSLKYRIQPHDPSEAFCGTHLIPAMLFSWLWCVFLFFCSVIFNWFDLAHSINIPFKHPIPVTLFARHTWSLQWCSLVDCCVLLFCFFSFVVRLSWKAALELWLLNAALDWEHWWLVTCGIILRWSSPFDASAVSASLPVKMEEVPWWDAFSQLIVMCGFSYCFFLLCNGRGGTSICLANFKTVAAWWGWVVCNCDVAVCFHVHDNNIFCRRRWHFVVVVSVVLFRKRRWWHMTHDTRQMRFRLTRDSFKKNIPSVTYVDTDHGNAAGSLDKKRNSAHGRPKWIGPWRNLKGCCTAWRKVGLGLFLRQWFWFLGSAKNYL